MHNSSNSSIVIKIPSETSAEEGLVIYQLLQGSSEKGKKTGRLAVRGKEEKLYRQTKMREIQSKNLIKVRPLTLHFPNSPADYNHCRKMVAGWPEALISESSKYEAQNATAAQIWIIKSPFTV